MNSVSVFSTRWHVKSFIGLHLFAFIWLGIFLTEGGFQFWRSIDQQVFFFLNGSLADGGSWAAFWAWANVRASDTVPAILMLVALSFPGMGIKRDRLQQALIGFILLLVLMFPIRETVYEVAVSMGVSGNSPSLTLEPVYFFSQMFPDIPAKDRAGHSFPGDHATVLLCWAGFMMLNARNLLSISALLLAFVFMLPRLVGGAHWASDNLVGGMFSAIITMAWAFCTPLMHIFTSQVHKLLQPVIRLFCKIPLLNKLPILQQSVR